MNAPLVLLTSRELATIAKVDPRTLNNWRRLHGLPFCTLPGGAIRYEQAAVLEWLRSRGQGMTPYERDQQTVNANGHRTDPVAATL